MATELKDTKDNKLTDDQLRRIFRDYLKGVPKERIIQKQQIDEGVFWEVVGLYAKRKHPNDVGNAKDITGPSDLLVSNLDTGSDARETPLIGHSPRDLRVPREMLKPAIEEYDLASKKEQLRVETGRLGDEIQQELSEAEEDRQEAAREQMIGSTETTGQILEDLEEDSIQGLKELRDKKLDELKEQPSAEEIGKATREAFEKRIIADQIGEGAIEEARLRYAQEHKDDWNKQVEEGKKLNEKLAKEETEARQKEAEQRKKDREKLIKEAQDAERRLAKLVGGPEDRPSQTGPTATPVGGADLGRGGEQGADNDRQASPTPGVREGPRNPPSPAPGGNAPQRGGKGDAGKKG